VLGLDICADVIIGDEMIRGISGGQKKRVTTGMHALYILQSLQTIIMHQFIYILFNFV
jgi:hypothetical protein